MATKSTISRAATWRARYSSVNETDRFLVMYLSAVMRHDEHVAERRRFLEVQHVAHVHEVEGAVAEDDRLVAEPLPEGRQVGERQDLPRPGPLALERRHLRGRIAGAARIKHLQRSPGRAPRRTAP